MKRILSFVLCLSMLLSMMPVSAFAADITEDIPVESTAATEVTETTGTVPTEPSVPETTVSLETTTATEETLPEGTEAETEPEETVPEETSKALSDEGEDAFLPQILTWIPDLDSYRNEDLKSDEALFAGYVHRQFNPGQSATYGTAGRETLDAGNQKIYDALAKQFKKIAAGERDSAIIAVGEDLGDLTFSNGDGTTVTYPCNVDAEDEIDVSNIDLALGQLLDVVLGDFAYELYWFDKTIGVSCAYLSDQGKGCYLFWFTVSPHYSATGAERTYELDTSLTGATATAVANARKIVTNYQGESDYDKLLGYMQTIMDLSDYNFDAADYDYDGGYGDPWQMIWVFDGDPSTKVVCEGFSKAYQYLCDQSSFVNDILCYSVVGYLNPPGPGYNGHMWNLVSINGDSYLVDVTNSSYSGSLFLKGGTISKGVHYFDYDAYQYVADDTIDGTYTFGSNKFVYDLETIALWGSEVTTLATESLTKADFPEGPETTPTEPEEPTEPEAPDAMTGQELLDAMAAAGSRPYFLFEPVVIDSDITLPASPTLFIWGAGSLTVKDGACLTVEGEIAAANGGSLTVEAGSSLTLKGLLCAAGGGTVSIDGSISLESTSRLELNFPGTITGIDPENIHFIAPVWNLESLLAAMTYSGYASQKLIVQGTDMDQDGNPDPIALTADLVIPDTWSFVIGDEMGTAASLILTEGVTLTVNGTLSLWHGASLVMEENTLLDGTGEILSDGTVTSCGTIDITIGGNGTVYEYMSQNQFLSLLDNSDSFAVTRPLTLTQAVTIPAGTFISFEEDGCLILAEGADLTVEGALTFAGTSLTVQNGGKLTLQGDAHLSFYGASALTIEPEADYAVLDGAEIYANAGTTLTGITKGEVCNSNFIENPEDNLQQVAETLGDGYKTFYLSIYTDYTVSEDMTIPANVVLDLSGSTLTVDNGAVLTVEGSWNLGMAVSTYSTQLVGGHIVINDGSLITKGDLDLTCGSTLTVQEGGSYTADGSFWVDERSSVANTGSVAINGSLSLDGQWTGTPPACGEGSTGPDTQYFFEKLLAEAEAAGTEAVLPYDITLSRSLTIPCDLTVANGVTLTVPKGITLTSQGQMLLENGAKLILEGTFAGKLPCPMGPDALFDHAAGTIAVTQNDLQAQLDTASGRVYVSVPMTLTKDLTVPDGAILEVLYGGSLTIPDGRNLINDGTVFITGTGSITADGGTLVNNSLVVNEAALDLSQGNYSHGETAQLILSYRNQGDENHINPTFLGDRFYGYVTMQLEGWSIAQLNNFLRTELSGKTVRDVQINVCGDLTLADPYEDTWVLPENTALYVGNLGYGPATLEITDGHILANAGCIEIGEGGTLVVRTGSALTGNLPLCHSGGVYTNENTKELTGLTENTTLTGPYRITGTLEVPSNITLTLSGDGASLVLEEGAQLVNKGQILVEKEASLDASSGSYTNAGGTLTGVYHCDDQGSVTRPNITGICANDLKFYVLTESDDAIVRELLDFVESLIDSGELTNYSSRDFFPIEFAGETVLSDDLYFPSYAMPCVTGTLTVPESVSLSHSSGLSVSGLLIANGWVDAYDYPTWFEGPECVVNPENCDNYIISGQILESISLGVSNPNPLVGEEVFLDVSTAPSSAPAPDADMFRYEIVSGTGTLDEYNVLTSDTAGSVTVRVTLLVFDDNGNLVPSDIYAETTVSFYASQISYELSNYDFSYFGNDCGLYAGSQATLSLSVPGNEGADSLELTMDDLYGHHATLTKEEGSYQLSISKDLSTYHILFFHATSSDGSAAPLDFTIPIRPKASSVDMILDNQIVTGKTVQIDLNQTSEIMLHHLTTPHDANDPYATDDQGNPLISWNPSSDEDIATVDQDGLVTFTGTKTGKVKISVTTNFGVEKTASVTLNTVKLAQSIAPGNVPEKLIGGSGATLTVVDETGETLKASEVTWSLCDREGNALDSHPYASVTAKGKLSTKAVADEIDVYLMARVIGNENVSTVVKVEIYPAIRSVQILVGETPISGTLLYDTDKLGSTYCLNYGAGLYEADVVKDVTWKSSASKVATIDDNGVIEVLKPGTAKFTLTVTALNNKKTSATVTMKFGVFTRDLALSALLPGSDGITEDLADLTLYGGQSIRFYGECLPENVTTSGVKWTLDSKTYATISSSGVLKAKAVTRPAMVTVTAQSKDGSCEQEIKVLILPKPTADGLDAMVLYTGDLCDGYSFLTKTTRTMAPGETLDVFASDYVICSEDAADGFEIIPGADVQWVSSNETVATVESDGRITTHKAGTAKITAEDDFGRTAFFTLKVSKSSVDVTITQKKTGSRDLSVASGKALNLMGTVTYTDDSTDTKVDWSVSDPSLATISTSGKLTAAKNITSAETVTVWAYAKDGTGAFDAIDVRIVPLTTDVEIFGAIGSSYRRDVTNTTRKWDLTDGDSFTLTARTFPAETMGVTWKSSNTKTVRIDPDSGEVTCLKAGTVTITATAKDGSGKKASFKLTVHKTMAEGSLTLPGIAFIGGGKKLTIPKLEGYGIDPEATNKNLTWSMVYHGGISVPKTVATLSSKGVLTTKAVKEPIGLWITATAQDGSGETAGIEVILYPLTKGVNLYLSDGETLVSRKTLTVPVGESITLLPDTTNNKAFGYTDDCTADEFLGGMAWDVTASRDIVRIELDPSDSFNCITVTPDGAQAGDTVKITLKAKDGSNKSTYVTLTFT